MSRNDGAPFIAGALFDSVAAPFIPGKPSRVEHGVCTGAFRRYDGIVVYCDRGECDHHTVHRGFNGKSPWSWVDDEHYGRSTAGSSS